MKKFEIENGVLKKYNEQSGKTIVEIPDKVKVIGQRAFENCYSLEKIVIPESVTIIQKFAFMDCTNLKEIKLPNSVAIIDSFAFYGCGLKEIAIPEGVTTIGYDVFKFCISLKKVSIPKSVMTISGSIFSFCENLKEIIIYSYSTFELLDYNKKIIAITSFMKSYLTKQIEYTKEDIEKFKKYIKKEKEYLLKISFKNPFVMYFLLNEIGEKFITYNEINNVINDYVEEIQPLDIKSIALLREYIKNNYDTDIDKQKKIGVI